MKLSHNILWPKCHIIDSIKSEYYKQAIDCPYECIRFVTGYYIDCFV